MLRVVVVVVGVGVGGGDGVVVVVVVVGVVSGVGVVVVAVENCRCRCCRCCRYRSFSLSSSSLSLCAAHIFCLSFFSFLRFSSGYFVFFIVLCFCVREWILQLLFSSVGMLLLRLCSVLLYLEPPSFPFFWFPLELSFYLSHVASVYFEPPDIIMYF